jgi:hypothetical protein
MHTPARGSRPINLTDLLLEPRLNEQDLNETHVWYDDGRPAPRMPDDPDAPPVPPAQDPGEMRNYPDFRPEFSDQDIQDMIEQWLQNDGLPRG